MSQVLERSPWLVDNVPLVLQLWDPSVVLCKPNPKTVPIWVTINNLPLSLWNGGNIGQVVSCVGKPLMLDQATLKRCETKEGPLNFARVLIDAKASNGLPDKVKINLPSYGETPGKSYFLNLSYKWKPPCCKNCEVFRHSVEKCPKNVQTVMKDQNLTKNGMVSKVGKVQVDEFIEVVKKPRAQNKGKTPIWQPIKTKNGPVMSEPGPSRQTGLQQLSLKVGSVRRKPNNEAMRLLGFTIVLIWAR
ncbi:putative transcription factor interactor and regulator CCHC(Zn) family [Helianthus annuus]|uniref:Transcription factor interactor and regulator CCHC(Zn) family n=1 Tax=Helianthus annuus TaxID=4232 RepID=A0A9K3NYL3_HELAN|nr:putative transcription factor interactor and regulator CCHC(Zn) family [Helianthus annuus]KAJ0950212.1 putative transcription factor interactor and regulator CCHC(Zn) family [Helianthus annuus]